MSNSHLKRPAYSVDDEDEDYDDPQEFLQRFLTSKSIPWCFQ